MPKITNSALPLAALLGVCALLPAPSRAQGFRQAAYDVRAPVFPHAYTPAQRADQDRRGVALLQDIQDKIKAGPVIYTVPPGVYRLPKGIDIHDSPGFRLNAAGCTFILVNTGDAFVSGGHARNVAVVGPMTIDHEPYRLSQAVITAGDPTTGIVTFRILPGYSADVSPKDIGTLYAPDGTQIMLPSWSGYSGAKAVDGAGGLFSLVAPKGAEALFVPGDLLSLPLNGGGPPQAFGFAGLHNFRLQDVQLGWGGALYSGGMPEGGSASFIRVRNGRMPGTNRLASGPSTQNWINAGSVLFDGCEFGNSTDDLMDFQGSGQHMYYRTQPDHPNQILTWNWFGGVGFGRGDKIAVCDRHNFATRVNAVVVAAVPFVDAAVLKDADKAADASGSFHLNRSGRTLTLVTLDRPVTAEPGDFLENLSQSAKSFTIRNCFFHDSAVQVMVEGFQRGVFTGNTFDHVNGGLALVANLYWPQGGAVSNVTVGDNVFRDCPYSTGWGSGGSALSVGAWWGNAPLSAGEGYSDRNVDIVGNRFFRCAKAAIGVSMAQNVTVANNRVDGVMTSGGDGAIELTLVGDARVSGNKIAGCKGPALHVRECDGIKATNNSVNGTPVSADAVKSVDSRGVAVAAR